MDLTGRRIVLGVTGGIAAYKACDLLREFVHAGAEVRVVLTAHGAEFVTATTFRSLGASSVIAEMFPRDVPADLAHVSTAEWAEIVVIAPATANVVAKAAHGLADDFLSTLILACPAPLVVAPAMNDLMYAHPATQENVSVLRSRGAHFVEPEIGTLASMKVGKGRLVDVGAIFAACADVLNAKRDLLGKRIVVTSGPTVEPIDDVRVVTNRSSGKMGHAIAIAAVERGAEVALVTGPVALPDPPGVKTVHVETAVQMRASVMKMVKNCDAFVSAAAVADYAPAKRVRGKPPKSRRGFSLVLAPTPDVLREVAAFAKRPILVGFALEQGRSLERAKEKMRAKKCDLMVFNSISDRGSGPGADTNRVTILSPDGKTERLPVMTKSAVARAIVDRLAGLLAR